MGRMRSIFYNALMLTGVNLLLRLVSTSFQVFISGRMGAGGVGLLQLVMSVASFSMTVAMAGIRTSTMYLTAEELGKNGSRNITWILSGCMIYSLFFSVGVGAVLYGLAPTVARGWIGDVRTVGAIRLVAVFLPVSCLCGVLTGYFTAANRIGTLAAVEVGEQLCSMLVTACALTFWAGDHVDKACEAVALGGCIGSCVTLMALVILRLQEKAKTGARIPVAKRLTAIALPLAVADDLKMGITTTENLMVPKRLALYSGAGAALAQFGTVCGMVFPVLMFPAAILYGLADLLIPEMARCNAAGSLRRIRYLSRRGLRLALFYGMACSGILYYLSDFLAMTLYKSEDAAYYLRLFSFLAPMLYCDAIVDALNKGLGKQRICVRINIITSIMDVIGLYFLLPTQGMKGYFISFLISHAVNALLSLCLLLKQTGLRIPVKIPMTVILTMGMSIWCVRRFENSLVQMVAFEGILFFVLYFCGIIQGEDLHWLGSLVGIGKKKEKN